MFNKNFYPTPKNLIDKMIDGLDTNLIETVLEPSAGKGDLAEAIKNIKNDGGCYRPQWNGVDCIEIEPELRSILKGKNLRVVGDDFLSLNTYKRYSLILMNPPFDDGDKHLLKALDMQKNGGRIVCLLNAETLRKPCTNTRKALAQQLEDCDAETEYIKDAFLSAERKTDVEIALVKINIPRKVVESKLLENLRRETEQAKLARAVSEEKVTGKLARFGDNNFVEMIVEQYNFEVKAGETLIREYEAMQPMLMERIQKAEKPEPYANCILRLKLDDKAYGNQANINKFVEQVRYKYWEALFNNPKFVGQLTENLRTALHNKLDTLKDYDFSVYNIFAIQEELMGETAKGVEATIIALFDEFSHKHHWKDETSKNVHYFNGWKTNKAHKINKKVIIPFYASKWNGGIDIYKAKNKFADVQKVFDYLDNGRTKYFDIDAEFKEHGECWGTISLKYFNVTFYKKGTAHITFRDLDLLNKFNLFGCQKKGWLPPNYGKKPYQDMNAEEQSVAQEFSGSEAEYTKIFANKEFYIVENTNQLLLEVAG